MQARRALNWKMRQMLMLSKLFGVGTASIFQSEQTEMIWSFPTKPALVIARTFGIHGNRMMISIAAKESGMMVSRARLIDADALMKSMYHRAFETDGDTMWQSGC